MSGVNKRLAIALAVSVALNLFFAGFVVARVLSPRHHDGPHAMGEAGPDGGRHMMRALRRARGGEPARRAMESHRGELREERRAMRRAHRAAAEALAADPFDRPRVEAALADVRARAAEMQEIAHRVVLDVAAELPAEERAGLLRGARRGAWRR